MLSKILLLEKRSGTTWNKLMKKELFNNIRFEKRIINDVVTTHKLVIEAKKIAYSNQIKYYYLKHQDSILGRKNENHSIDLYKAVLERYDFLKEKYPDFIQNEIGVLLIILILYVDEKENLQKFLKKENVLQEYNKLFSFKILFCRFKLKDKIKILLFRISPNLYRKIVKIYLKIKKIYKRK
jgi:hypothetical protein